LTVLSGDLDQDDLLDDGNTYHVVTGSGVDEYSILDGFTIIGGNANGDNMQYQNRGGGMFNHWDSDLTLAHITFSANWADLGGGLFNDSSSPTLT
ncbi:MAG: hypothetical protein GWN58_04225, partial [Anaerolineae bacterium]|nr:hypothetical protein [Anaerolineae bacterium]